MIEQLDGQIAVSDSSSKPAPLVSQDDMRDYQDSLPKKVQAQPPFVLEFTDPYKVPSSDGGLKQKFDTENDGTVSDESKPLQPRDGGVKEKILGGNEGLVFDESKPVEPRDGGEKSPLVCIPEDSTGLGIELPPIEFVDPRVEEARRRLERIERAEQ